MKKKSHGKHGFFISFEGPECAGKTTHIKMLRDYFLKKKKDCLTTREPGGTEIGEEIRNMVKYHIGETAAVDEAELLLFAAGRAQHVKKVILPALAKDMIVISDRFTDSTTAYQGYGRGLDLDFIRTLNNFASCGLSPNLTVVLDLTAEESLERSLKREENLLDRDRIESEVISFHRKVREGFLKIALSEPERVKVIPSNQPVETVHKQILKLVKNAVEQI